MKSDAFLVFMMLIFLASCKHETYIADSRGGGGHGTFSIAVVNVTVNAGISGRRKGRAAWEKGRAPYSMMLSREGS